MRLLMKLLGRAMINAAPRTGGTAASPGKGVALLNLKQHVVMRRKPKAARALSIHAGRFKAAMRDPDRANATPTASSHARDGRR